MNYVPSIGSKPNKLSPEQEEDLKRHFQQSLGRQAGIEPDLFGYAIVFLAIVALVFGYFFF